MTKYAFSDGSPFAELAILGITFLLVAITAILMRQTRYSGCLDRSFDSVGDFLRRRLFAIDHPESEQHRLDFLRIVLGGMALLRNIPNLATSVQLGDSMLITVTGVATLLSFLLIIGFAVPLTAAIFCITLNTILDNLAYTSCLSSLILSMTLLPLVLAPAGRSLSIDSVIMRSSGRLGQIWCEFYACWGPLTLNRAAWGKLLLLLAYAGISLSSGLLHLQFDAWIRGLTNTLMFINPVANPNFYKTADSIYEFSPSIYIFLTRSSAYGTLIFQLAMVPLLLMNRWTRALIITLELGFVVGSISLLALKWLGWNQLVLWAILFWNRWKLNIAGRDSLAVLYDDRCNLCDRTMRFLRAIDIFKVLEFRPLTCNLEFARNNGILHAEALKNLYCVDNVERVRSGYEFYLAVTNRIFLLTPFFPILWLGKATRLGPAIYDYVAARRIALSGVCRKAPITNSARSTASKIGRSYNTLFCGMVGTFMIMLLAYSCRLPITPFVPAMDEAAQLSKRVFGQAPVAFGLWQINAFNFNMSGGGFSGGTQFWSELTWSKSGDDETQSLMWIPPVRADILVSDMLFYQVVVHWVNMHQDFNTGQCFSAESIQTLLEKPGLQAVLRQDRFSSGDFHVRLRAFTTPVLDDFLSKRYVPRVWRDICEASFPAQTLSPITFN